MAGAELSLGDGGDYAVVTLRGELDAVSAASAAAVVTVAGEHVIVDLSAVEFMDCCPGVYASASAAAASTGRDRHTTSQHAPGRAPPARTPPPPAGPHGATATRTRPYVHTGC